MLSLRSYRTRLLCGSPPAGRRAPRKGAILSLELVLALSVCVVLFFAMFEFSMLLATNTRLQMASRLGCRAGTLPAVDAAQQELAICEAVDRALARSDLIEARTLNLELGQYAGDEVAVEIRLPMDAAAPNLLVPLGFDLAGHELTVRTVMRKE